MARNCLAQKLTHHWPVLTYIKSTGENGEVAALWEFKLEGVETENSK